MRRGRVNILTTLAEQLDGSAHELDVSDPQAIERVVIEVAALLGGLDAIVYTSASAPFALIEDTDVTTGCTLNAVNAVGASHLLRAAVPHLADNAVALVASSHDVGRPRAGVAAYHASNAALDEILRSWRAEHPELPVIRVSVGPTEGTEILRGADRDLLADLYRTWAQEESDSSRDVRGRRCRECLAVLHCRRAGQPDGRQRHRAPRAAGRLEAKLRRNRDGSGFRGC